MNKIYIIIGYKGGEYEDTNWNVTSFFDKVAAETRCEEMNNWCNNTNCDSKSVKNPYEDNFWSSTLGYDIEELDIE